MAKLRPQFVIRAPNWLWILLPTVVAVLTAAVFVFGVPIYRQQIAIRTIVRLKGRYDAIPRGPDWLRGWTGKWRIGPLDKVTHLVLENTDVNDTDMATLSGLTDLAFLAIGGTSISDAGLEHLTQMTELQGLILGDTQLTDEGLHHLTGLTKLESLYLDKTHVSDAGLAHLKVLPNLRRVYLYGAGVTNEGVADLEHSCPSLVINRVTR